MILPDSFGMLKNLKNLYLKHSRIKNFPKSFEELGNLEELDLYACQELMMLPNSLGMLKNLKNLNFHHSGIKNLPKSFEELRNWEKLD